MPQMKCSEGAFESPPLYTMMRLPGLKTRVLVDIRRNRRSLYLKHIKEAQFAGNTE